MPPKRASSSASSSAASGSSSSSSGSSSSSSGSSSSSSGEDSDDNSSSDDSDSDSSASQNSRRSRASTRSRSSRASASSASSPTAAASKSKASSKVKKKGAKNATTRSRSASLASEGDSSKKKSSDKKSSSKKASSKSLQQQQRKVAPKKSATAKPLASAVAKTSKKSTLSDDAADSDSDFGDFSLSKFSAKAKQAKKNQAAGLASTASSSSAGNTPRAVPTPAATPTATHGVAAAATAAASKPNAAAASFSTAGNKKTGGSVAAAGDQSKLKSIFSASSESETDVKKKKGKRASPSPPRLSPQKKAGKAKTKAASASAETASAATASAASKKKVAPKTKKRASSISSEASSASSRSSSRLSRTTSPDSSDSEVKFSTKSTAAAAKNKKKPSGAQLAAAARKKAAATAAARGQKGRPPGKKKVTAAAAKKAAAAAAHSSDSDAETPRKARPNTRQTRGGAPRRSKHVTGTGRKAPTESESEGDITAAGLASGSSSPRKKASSSSAVAGIPFSNSSNGGGSAFGGVGSLSSASGSFSAANLPPVRRNIDGLPAIETRKCPVPGCDSFGHLGGRLERHFLVDACPVFHNTSRKDCKDLRGELNKKIAVRKKALTVLATKSPLQGPTSEQKKHSQKIKDARSSHRTNDLPSAGLDEPPEDREVDLTSFAAVWDLKLFREAQALASEDMEASLKGLPDTKTTRYIEMGKYEMEVWYQSPYPEEFTCLPRIYICEFCLKHMKSSTVLRRHATKCVWKHPPGDEIYRRDKISVFEICGKRHKQYCQSLCLLAKFFLDHKTLYFDVEPFLFYVMTAADEQGCHVVGYFSKEKNSFQNYNVSCILTLPPYQRQGYGRLLIDFSYLLTRMEGKVGSPEKPLSDLGLITYRAYWKDVILEHVVNCPDREISVRQFSEERGIQTYDIVSTLQYLGMIKYWKGQHVILKKEDLIEEYLRKSRQRPRGRQIHPGALKWKPYEPTAKERRHAEQIKKNQEERQKKR